MLSWTPSLLVLAGSLTGLLGVLVLIILWFFGAFRSITFQNGRLGPSTIFVYKTSQGPYSGVGPHFAVVNEFLAKHKLQDYATTAGIYYDDPKTTDTPRYAVGFLVNGDDDKVQEESKQWSVLQIKDTATMMSSFPMHWMPISCAISAIKTYPAFEKYQQQQQQQKSFVLKSGTMEIYRNDTGVIETHFPQDNFDQFNPQEFDSFLTTNKKEN